MNKLTRLMAGAICAALGVAGTSRAADTVLFSDDFETDSSTLWNVEEGSGSGVADYTVDWAFDYGTAPQEIPSAPNSAGTTRGVKLTVNNNDATPDTAAVNLYVADESFTGNYAVRFDMWINYNGGAFGGTGSTEFAIFGLNHLGTEPNWASSSLTTSDGIWFAVTGEGGAARDYRNYEGDGAGAPLEYQGIDGGMLDRDGDGTPEYEVTGDTAADPDYPLNLLFPVPPFETAGMPSKQWVEVEVRQRDGVISWLINGYVVAEKVNTSLFFEGTAMIGMMDIFSSIANPAADNFVLFDNVRVVSLEDAPLPRLTLQPVILDASEPGTAGSFTITRDGDAAEAVEVNLGVLGTARAGVDYETIPTIATIPAGEFQVTIPVTPINDQSGEPTETVSLYLVNNPDAYEVFAPMLGTVNILDDGDVSVVGIQTLNDLAFEGLNFEGALFSIYRVGDANSDLFVNLEVSGSATSGADYEAVFTPVMIPFGSTNVLVTIPALADEVEDAGEEIVVSLIEETGYTVAEAEGSGTATIAEAGPVVYSDDFNTDTSAQYSLLFDAANDIEDYRVGYAFDYSQTETFVPPIPEGDGSTSGLLLTVNKNDDTGSAASVNVYTDESFAGDYLVKFDMFLTFDSSSGGTTEAAIFGVNHSGQFTNRYNTAGSDGIWFFVETDGSSQGDRGYVIFQPEDTSAVPPFEPRRADDPYFTSFFTVPPFIAPGSPAGDWVDVSILQQGDVITWKIDNLPIFQRTNTTTMDSGKVMLGFADTFNSVGSTNNFVIYDNLRVYQIGEAPVEPGEITITAVEQGEGGIVLTVTTTGSLENLQLVGAETVDGTYTEVADATIEVVNETTARATIPATGDHRFFQVLEN